MPNSKTMFIAEIAGPGGSYDKIDAWVRKVAAAISGTAGLERVGRYRRLNDNCALLVAEFADGAETEDVAQALSAPPSSLKVKAATGRQLSEQRRADAAADPRESSLFYTVSFPVPADREPALSEWYELEHAPLLLGSEHWSMVRRYHLTGPAADEWGPHLAVHYLTDIRALRSPERDSARNTPWRKRLEVEPWFRGRYNVCLQEL